MLILNMAGEIFLGYRVGGDSGFSVSVTIDSAINVYKFLVKVDVSLYLEKPRYLKHTCISSVPYGYRANKKDGELIAKDVLDKIINYTENPRDELYADSLDTIFSEHVYAYYKERYDEAQRHSSV